MRQAWVRRVGMVTLVGGLCLVGYGLAHAERPIKDRFVVLSKDPAWVLDRTTGLQWQKTLTTEHIAWSTADAYCSSLGGGSRLPEIKELISLVDYSQYNPPLPPGHPFQNVQPAGYWSASAYEGAPSSAWGVGFGDGAVNFGSYTLSLLAWCVR